MASTKRDHLVETALDLFSRDGFRATGIDRILAESGVAKMTLYNHFRSKDELILAALRLRDERFRNRLMREVETRASHPAARLLAIFDVLGDWFGQEGFTGCAFINASAEFVDPDSAIHAAAAEHKRLIEAYVRGLTEDAGAADPTALARRLCLLIDGAIVTAQVCGDCQAGVHARAAAETLLRDAGVTPPA
jgi:AcrR family transcriptional regulator